MKKKTKRPGNLVTGSICAVAAFILLSIFAGGLVEVSRDVGFLRWMLDLLAYSFTNKLAYKLVASIAIGGAACFVSSMTAYGRSVKQRRRATRVRFDADVHEPGVGRIA